MLAAYQGTIDDSGETIDGAREEVARVLSGAYGRFNSSASEVTPIDGELASATIITEMKGEPLLAFSMTAPQYKRQGLARAGLLRAIRRLKDAGHARLLLVVTEGNTPAEQLYTSIGFQRIASPGSAG